MPFIFGPGTGGRIKAIILKKTPRTNTPGVNIDHISLSVLPFLQNVTEILNTSPISYASQLDICLPSASQAVKFTNPVTAHKVPSDLLIKNVSSTKVIQLEK